MSWNITTYRGELCFINRVILFQRIKDYFIFNTLHRVLLFYFEGKFEYAIIYNIINTFL